MSNENTPASFMDRVRALKSDHSLCVIERSGAKVAALHALTNDERITLRCERCRASWTLTITPADAAELQRYLDERRQQSTNEERHDPEARS